MSEYGWITSVVAGLLTGGTSAGTTFLAVFRDIKKKIGDLETAVGSDKTDPKTGLFFSVALLLEQVRKIRREIDEWEDYPPEWAQRAARRSSVNTEAQDELERRIEQKLAVFSRRLNQIENDLTNIEARFVSRDLYDDDSRRRASEIEKIRDSLATASSWQRGILAALGYIDENTGAPSGLFLPKKK
jgi:hypothetical protein